MKWKMGDLELSSKGVFIMTVDAAVPHGRLSQSWCVQQDDRCRCSVFERAWGWPGRWPGLGELWYRIVCDAQRYAGRPSGE